MNTLDPTPSYQLPSVDLLDNPALQQQLSLLLETGANCVLPILWSVQPEPVIRDLSDINHLLVVGAQGQGKSNFLHQILISILFTRKPDEVKLLLIDFNRLDFLPYAHITSHFLLDIPGLSLPIISQTTGNVLTAFQALRLEIARRLGLFVQSNVRNIHEYHRKQSKLDMEATDTDQLPYLIVAVDELADLNLHAEKELRDLIDRLLFTAAKAGVIFLLSSGVISGNSLPAGILSGVEERVVFRLFDREDYRKYLDTVSFPAPQSKGQFVYRQSNRIASGHSILIHPDSLSAILNQIG